MADQPDPFSRWADDPDLQRLGAQMNAELRAEAEEYERLAALDTLRGRGLPEVALELLHRGDVVSVELAHRSFVGTVVYTAGDLLSLRTALADVDVWLQAPLALQVLERVRDGGRGRAVGPASFKARLFEHEAASGQVTIGCRLGSGVLVGRLHAVAVDHVVVEAASGERCYLSLRAIEYVAHGAR